MPTPKMFAVISAGALSVLVVSIVQMFGPPMDPATANAFELVIRYLYSWVGGSSDAILTALVMAGAGWLKKE